MERSGAWPITAQHKPCKYKDVCSKASDSLVWAGLARCLTRPRILPFQGLLYAAQCPRPVVAYPLLQLIPTDSSSTSSKYRTSSSFQTPFRVPMNGIREVKVYILVILGMSVVTSTYNDNVVKAWSNWNPARLPQSLADLRSLIRTALRGIDMRLIARVRESYGSNEVIQTRWERLDAETRILFAEIRRRTLFDLSYASISKSSATKATSGPLSPARIASII